MRMLNCVGDSRSIVHRCSHHNGRRYSRSPLEEEQDYDGPGYVVMENLTKSSEVPDLVETENPLGTDYWETPLLLGLT